MSTVSRLARIGFAQQRRKERPEIACAIETNRPRVLSPARHASPASQPRSPRGAVFADSFACGSERTAAKARIDPPVGTTTWAGSASPSRAADGSSFRREERCSNPSAEPSLTPARPSCLPTLVSQVEQCGPGFAVVLIGLPVHLLKLDIDLPDLLLVPLRGLLDQRHQRHVVAIQPGTVDVTVTIRPMIARPSNRASGQPNPPSGMLARNLASVAYPDASCSPWRCSEVPRRTKLDPRDPPSACFRLPARLRKAQRIVAYRKRIRTPVDGLRSDHRPPAPAWRIEPPVRSAGIEPFSACLPLQPRLQRLIWTERCNRQVWSRKRASSCRHGTTIASPQPVANARCSRSPYRWPAGDLAHGHSKRAPAGRRRRDARGNLAVSAQAAL